MFRSSRCVTWCRRRRVCGRRRSTVVVDWSMISSFSSWVLLQQCGTPPRLPPPLRWPSRNGSATRCSRGSARDKLPRPHARAAAQTTKGSPTMHMILMGPPGSGKGTQAKVIGTHFAIPAISTGDIFRANVSGHTPLGLKAQRYMEAGEYVPDEVTNAMVRDRLNLDDCRSGFL